MEKTLPISQKQAEMLVTLNGEVAIAQNRLGLAAGAVLAGHNIDKAEIVRIEAGEPPMLVVRLEDAESPQEA